MQRHHLSIFGSAALVFAASGALAQPAMQGHAMMKGESRGDDHLIASAMTAAPPAIAGDATIVAPDAKGAMRVVRKGAGNFTCMPDNPVTPGPDPMCGDANAMAWAMAWMEHKTPVGDKPGFMYMLSGGTDASNTDPYATKPDGDWVSTGPHVMVVGSQAMLAGYPSGARPDTTKPYVMWAGTPYAHLMIPVK
ncbi:hypothetical protein [Phenylobacterium sp.]|uniref:hypothetical protein n=1 Tax=Phenylobacterium sp. TaxID=1871053 RepID=UPI0035B333C0